MVMTMRHRRSYIECLIAILQALEQQKQATKITHLTYRTNLNMSRLKKYLHYLKTQGLVLELTGPRNGKYFQITEQGRQALEYFRQFTNVMSGERRKEEMSIG